MKRFLLGLISVAVGTAAVWAQIPIFENRAVMPNGTNNPPQIDALAFANYGTFNVSTTLPFDFTNVRHYTNRGTMIGSPGFIFDTAFSVGKRVPAEDFVNASGATITSSEGGFGAGGGLGFIGGPGQSTVSPSYLEILATNVSAQGIMSVGAGGLLRIQGNSVDLTRAGLEVRRLTASPVRPFVTETNFYPDVGITDVYWGMTNDFMRPGTLLDVSVGGTNITVPLHGVTNTTGQLRTSFRVPNAQAFVQTNRVTETNWLVQAAFVGIIDPNLSTQVRFAPSPLLTNLYKTIVAELSMPETNVVTGDVAINTLYLTDELASNTNWVTLNNLLASPAQTYRPGNYILTRSPPNEFITGTPGTGLLTPDLFYSANLSNNIVTNFYSSYAAQISTLPFRVPQVPGFEITDLPGRVEIRAQDLNMNRTRIRGNALVDIATPNLLSSSNSVVDSPNLNFNLGAIRRILTVTNLAKLTVARFSGQLRAWSAVWTNDSGSVATNIGVDPNDATMMVTNVVTNVIEIGYHIFVVDTSGLRTQSPVLTYDLRMHAPDIVLGDSVNVVHSLLIDGNSFTIKGTLALSDQVQDWRGTNAPALRFFTNDGALVIPNAAYFTEGRTSPYASFVNSGSISAAGMTLNSDYFENRGTIAVSDDGVNITTTTASLQGGTVTSARDVVYTASNLKAFNYTNNVAGTLTFNVSGGLADSGAGSDNLWTVQNGFELLVKPLAGDLLGTTLRTVAPRFTTVQHRWAAEDRGASTAGFNNNEAVGVLILNANADGALQFSPVGANNALYVDSLLLTNALLTAFQSGDLQSALIIDPGMKIYFASANVPADQLNGQLGGRLIWVQQFIGPNSAVDVLRKDGRTEQMNRSVRESTTIDSDNDGLANAFDPFPLDPDSPLSLTGVLVSTPAPSVQFSWEAKPNTVYRLEYTPSLGSGDWRFLSQYTNSSTTAKSAMAQDQVASGAVQRYYRVQSVEQRK